MDIGSIKASLVLSMADWNRNVDKAKKDMQQMEHGAHGAANGLDRIQSAGVGLGLAVGTAFGASLRAASNFESSMAKVKAITNANESQFADLTKAAKEMAANSVFGADQVSQAMYNLGSAGYDANKIIETMPGLLNLAAAAQTDLGTAAEITTSIMSGFGIEASRAAEVADILAQASNSSNASIPDLGEAMKYVAPVAKTLGLNLEQTAASIGLLSNVGIKGSQAGTVLRASLLALINPAKESQQLMDSLGISVTNSEGKMKPLPELLGHFGDKLKGMTQAQKAATISQLVGTEAASGFLSLIDAGPQQLMDFEKALKNSGGTAKKVADTQMNTLKGKVEELKGALENVGIEIGEDFLPILSDFAKDVAKVISGFDELDKANMEGILAFGGTAAAVALLSSTIGKLALSARTLLTTMGPAGWLITGVSIFSGVIAGAVAKNKELDTAMLSNIKTQFDNAKSLDEQIKKYDELKTKSKLTSDEFGQYLYLQERIKNETDPKVLADLSKEADSLREKSGLSNKELDTMVGLNKDLIEKVPEATDKISKQGKAVIDNTDALKKYSKEKLASLYQDLDLERIKNETKYKNLLEDEQKLIQKIKDDNDKLTELKGKRTEAQQKLNDEQAKLDEMMANSEKYSQAALQAQIEKTANARYALELAQKHLEKQAESIQQDEKDLSSTRKKLEALEEIRFQMTQIALKQVGLTAEKGKELEAINGAIGKLEAQKKKLEETTPAAQKNTEEYRNALTAIDNQISALQNTKQKVQEITNQAIDMNLQLGKAIFKDITVREKRYQSFSSGIASGRNSEYHTGGIIGRGQLPQLHTGGPAWAATPIGIDSEESRLIAIQTIEMIQLLMESEGARIQ